MKTLRIVLVLGLSVLFACSGGVDSAPEGALPPIVFAGPAPVLPANAGETLSSLAETVVSPPETDSLP